MVYPSVTCEHSSDVFNKACLTLLFLALLSLVRSVSPTALLALVFNSWLVAPTTLALLPTISFLSPPTLLTRSLPVLLTPASPRPSWCTSSPPTPSPPSTRLTPMLRYALFAHFSLSLLNCLRLTRAVLSILPLASSTLSSSLRYVTIHLNSRVLDTDSKRLVSPRWYRVHW